MPRESKAAKQARAQKVEERMLAHYGEGECSLDYESDPFRLVCAVVLSAQCTDAAVNKVTPSLFKKYPTCSQLAQAKVTDVEKIIHSLGFFRAKAANLIKLSQMLVSDFVGEVPNDINLLQKLPGVGRKTANVVMCEAFRNPQGIAHRLKFAGPSADTPDKTEKALLNIYPQKDWLFINHQWVHFGREFCRAQRPRCADCIIGDLCPSFDGETPA